MIEFTHAVSTLIINENGTSKDVRGCHYDGCTATIEHQSDVRQVEVRWGELDLIDAGWDVFTYQPDKPWGPYQTQHCPRHARRWSLKYWARRFQLRIGRLRFWRSPQWGDCGLCKTPYGYWSGYDLKYGQDGETSEHGDMGALICRKCWDTSSPELRAEGYRRIFHCQDDRGGWSLPAIAQVEQTILTR